MIFKYQVVNYFTSKQSPQKMNTESAELPKDEPETETITPRRYLRIKKDLKAKGIRVYDALDDGYDIIRDSVMVTSCVTQL